AGSQEEDALDHPDERIALGCRDERPEIRRITLGTRAPGDADPGERLAGEFYVGIPLRILEIDIVLRLVLLDQVIFQEERLGLGIGHHHADTCDSFNEAPVLEVVILFLEVTAHPLLEVLCLADIDDRALLVEKEVAAGITRQGSSIEHRCTSVWCASS